MDKQKKSVGGAVLVILLLIVTVASLVLATYAWARYTTTTTASTSTAEVAKWNPTFTQEGTFVGEYNHVANLNIAPGTTGTFTVVPDAGATEVCYDYTITISSIQLLNGNTALAPDATIKAADDNNAVVTVQNVLDHISLTCGTVDFKTASVSGTRDIVDGKANHAAAAWRNNTTGAATAFNTTNGTYTFTWNWPYQLTTGTDTEKTRYDYVDTAAGEFAAKTGNDLKLKINYTITATQVDPNA